MISFSKNLSANDAKISLKIDMLWRLCVYNNYKAI